MDYAAEVTIPLELLVRDGYYEGYAKQAVEIMLQDGAIKVFSEIYQSKYPVVVETHMEEWDDHNGNTRKYRLHYRLTAVRTRDVVFAVPVFTYQNHEGKVEWKCPACSIINSIEATVCGEKHYNAIGCGRPRDKTRQEMYA